MTPLSQTTTYVLASLLEGPRHGYALFAEIADLSGGDVNIGVGNVYVLLRSLVERGMIEAVGSDGRRNPYRITTAGIATLDAECERMRRILDAVERRKSDVDGAPQGGLP